MLEMFESEFNEQYIIICIMYKMTYSFSLV